jgi:hypothetical protein
MSNGDESDWTGWSTDASSVWLNRWTDEAGPTTVVLRHPTAPFLEHLSDGSNQAELRAGALKYLDDVAPRFGLGLPPDWLDGEGAWAPIGGLEQPYWFTSFWFERKDQKGSPIDRTLVLAMSRPRGDDPAYLGFGLRVVAHVRARDGQGYEMRITGMSARLPSDRTTVGLAGALREAPSTPYQFEKVDLTTPAQTDAFRCDPASQGGSADLRTRRPTRSEDALDALRDVVPIPIPKGAAGQAGTSGLPLEAPDRLKVMQSRFILGDDPTKGVKRLRPPPDGKFPVRSNEFNAVSAFHHFWGLFERFERYGIDSHAYFRSAQLPLKVEYRSGMAKGPGRDGETVNARVGAVWRDEENRWKRDNAGPPSPREVPGVEVHLALANLSHRGRQPWNRKDRSPAEPLGIAADPRWAWHEIGHVLLLAATGELEFRFAHSPGDALAAIVADPHSELAEDPRCRGATFPWVFVPRRHDRCVHEGWSWSGTMHEGLRRLPEAKRTRQKAYRSEQILSSSLFRMYLCLGGATTKSAGSKPVPDRDAREDASDYAVFLIMKGLNLLGNALLVPANDPDQLVSALIDADVGTEWFDGNRHRRVGGCAHKAIRWAFEAQGLYAADPNAISNEPGAPEAVDIYIEDRRGLVERMQTGRVEHGPGSYVPVSLHWPDTRAGLDALEWLATANALSVQDGRILVRVGNRGGTVAEAVSVGVWWRPYRAGEELPQWNDGGWTAISPPPPTGNVEPGALVQFGLPAPSAEDYLLFAQATCAADRANSDPATHLPCSLAPTPLADLVANDNNLGVVVVQSL